jgi:peptidoglycan/xylan/chitin deacetylase (PgdA/CDA1 family)
VANPSEDSFDVCVSPEHFAEQLEVLRKHTRPVPLSQLVRNLRDGSLLPRSVAVTFDDGYIDNFHQARPLLEKYEIPVTVFICSGYAGREFWWDEADRRVMASGADLYALRLQLGERLFQWDPLPLRPDAVNSEEPSRRRRFSQELYRFLIELDVLDLNKAMETIRTWSGLPDNGAMTARVLNPEEIRQFGDSGIVELGSHTRNHLMLPQLPLQRQREEILWGKRDLEAWLGRPVESFAYPNGRSTEAAKQIVREAGFIYACTSLHDVVRPGSDLYDLNRFWQKDVDGDKFFRGLNSWMRMSGAHG